MSRKQSFQFVQLYGDRAHSAGEPELGLLHVEDLHLSHLLTPTGSYTWLPQNANSLNDLRPCNVHLGFSLAFQNKMEFPKEENELLEHWYVAHRCTIFLCIWDGKYSTGW